MIKNSKHDGYELINYTGYNYIIKFIIVIYIYIILN